MRHAETAEMLNKLSKADLVPPSLKKQVLCMLNLQGADDLLELLHNLGKNKKKSNDTWVLQTAINLCMTAPTSVANEYTKPQLSMYIINKFHSYAWAATGNEISDGITPFNITFVTKTATSAMAAKVECHRAVKSRATAMSYSDAELFLKADTHFPANATTCTYCLAMHSLSVDLMLGENSLFTVTYQHCVQALQSHLLLSLNLHYGDGLYMIALQIMYWLTQQFLCYLSQHNFGYTSQLPTFEALLQHDHAQIIII